jgi:hypothetical protein
MVFYPFDITTTKVESCMNTKIRTPGTVFNLVGSGRKKIWKIILPILLVSAILGSSIVMNTPVFAASVVLTAPSAFTWSDSFGVGANTGSATTGSVVSSGATAGWTLSVADHNAGAGTGHMMTGTTPLAAAIQVGMSSGSGTIEEYQTALQNATGYSQANGTFNIPLYASQTVATTDAPGAYSITLDYTLSSVY